MSNYSRQRTPAYDTLSHLEAASFAQPLHSSQALGWETLDAMSLHLQPMPDPDLIPEIMMNQDGIILTLDGSFDLNRSLDGRWAHGHSGTGLMSISPQKTPMKFFWTDEATNLYLYFKPTFLSEVAQEIGRGDPLHVYLREQFNIRDPFIQQIGWALLGELQTNGETGRVYAETLALTLGIHLLRRYTNLIPQTQSPDGRLSIAQLQRVKDYIDGHISENIGLNELAAYANASPSHFGRWFKKSVGTTPHQFIIQRRVERAHQLLTQPGMTITQTAQEVGFYDQSHLVRHFKRVFGISPQAIQQYLKSKKEQ